MKLWVGVEKEGELFGIKTLFVGSHNIKYEKILDILNNDKLIGQIYFGAGLCSRVNFYVLNKIINNKNLDYLIITMEVNINKLNEINLNKLTDVRIIVTINHKNFSLFKNVKYKDMLNIKLQSLYTKNKILTIGNYENFNNFNLKDLKVKTYKGDKVIE